MNVTDRFFEMGITFFKDLVYTAIRYAVANGDVVPFVWHNAGLLWKVLQDISYAEDGIGKFWLEATVSEYFDMALRLQCEGYLVRSGAYTQSGFKEGVSLTVYDELLRGGNTLTVVTSWFFIPSKTGSSKALSHHF